MQYIVRISFPELGFSKDSEVASFHLHYRSFWPRQVKVQTAFTRALVGMVNMETGLGNQAPVKRFSSSFSFFFWTCCKKRRVDVEVAGQGCRRSEKFTLLLICCAGCDPPNYPPLSCWSLRLVTEDRI